MKTQGSAAAPSIDEIVFEKRNKEYGAYLLRKIYDRNVTLSVFLGLGFFIFAVSLPEIIKFLKPEEIVEKGPRKVITITELGPPPPIDANVPPPPKLKVPPPKVKEAIKFLPPKVTEKEVEEEIPTVEELKEVPIATENTEGDGDVVFEEPTDVIGDEPAEDALFTVVEQMPEFPGGYEKMQQYIAKNMKYPASAIRMGIEGSVYLSFIIDKDGKISSVEVLKGISQDCNNEAMRVVKSMPAWKPGKQAGRPVNVKFSIPIKFKLD